MKLRKQTRDYWKGEYSGTGIKSTLINVCVACTLFDVVREKLVIHMRRIHFYYALERQISIFDWESLQQEVCK